jgi:tetratricopeptide (TPR) repeat protein
MEDQEFAVPDGTLAMVFVEKKQMDQDEVRYIKKMRWKLTDPLVFPRLFRMAKNEPDLPSREEFEMTSAILRALVQVTEQLELEPYEPEIAPFSTPVSVHSGNQVFNFEVIFPAGEIPEDMKDSLSDDYEGEEDEDDDIFSIDPFGLGLQEDPLLSTDELKEADQLAGQADEVESEDEAIRLAQQALAASPNHPLPYLVMEQHTDDEEERKRWIREGVQAFDRLLEKADSVTRMKFFAHATDFSTGAAAWDLLYDQAELAVEENDFDTAQAAYERMLELEYEDYEEIRSLLMELYLRAGKNEQARKLLSNYEDHFGVGEYYLRALVQFRVEGNTGPARKNLNIAFKDNRDIADYLTARKPMPLPSFAIETEEEDDEDEMVVDEDDNDMDNINFVQRYFQIAYSTPGFIDWLKKHTK